MTEQDEIQKTYSLPFPRSVVYAAWVSSSTVIPPATSMDIDPVVGGHYRLLMETDEYVGSNEGRFIEVIPNSALRYTWEWNSDGNVSEIKVEFTDEEDGGTRVDLTHSGLADAQAVASHASGWDSYIEGFQRHIADSSS